jgi:hypothetical protein
MKKVFTLSLVEIFVLLLLVVCSREVLAQSQLGAGIHFAPPVTIDNHCNSYVIAKPILVPAYSFSYRRVMGEKKRWYVEGGFTTMGMGVNVQNFYNDTLEIWGEYVYTHVGFSSVSLGGGVIFPLTRKLPFRDFTIGLGGSYRLEYSLGKLYSKNFGFNYSSKDAPFPLFLRFNLGYGIHETLFSRIPFYLQAYTNMSFQLIARSPQYIRDPSTGQAMEEGKYRLNNSEIGLKLFINTDIRLNERKQRLKGLKLREKRTKPLVYRLSIEGQAYAPPATKYLIPRVDSFSLTGMRLTYANQVGIKLEVSNPKNYHWTLISGVNYGITTISTNFKASPFFTKTNGNIDYSGWSPISKYIMPNIGLAYIHPVGKKHMQHSASATLVVPIEKEGKGTKVFDGTYPSLPPHLWPSILYTYVDYDYGRSSALLGLEYQTELLVNLDKRFFYGIGLVFNLSSGVIAQGRAIVDNGRTQYYGGIIQNFSKIGVTARIGWNSVRKN